MLGKKTVSLVLALSASVVLGTAPRPAQADTPISSLEWAFLPEYCKAALILSSYATMIPIENRVSRDAYLQKYGKPTHGIFGPNHFCMGLVYFNRAKRGSGSYEHALNEFSYSHAQMEKSAPTYSYVNSYMGMALYRLGKRDQARRLWEDGMATQPEQRDCYLALAEALLSEHRSQEALNVLLKYDEVKEADYPDAEHFMAQAYFDLKRYDESKQHLEKAYELGYPAHGLRDKLKRLGKY